MKRTKTTNLPKRQRTAPPPSRVSISSSRLRSVRPSPKESGYVDFQQNFDFDTTGTIALIATVAQGTTVNQRVGKKIVWKGIQCRGYMFSNTTAIFNDCALMIVYDNRPTGALPAITDILVTANSTAMNNDANSGRFKILKRLDFRLAGSSTTQLDVSTASADFYLPLLNSPCEFKAAGTGAIADISEGCLYCVTVGINAAGTTAAAANLNFRTRFFDV